MSATPPPTPPTATTRRPWVIVGVLTALLIASSAFGAWAFIELRAERDDSKSASARVSEARKEASSARERLDEAQDDNKDLEDEVDDLKDKIADLEEGSAGGDNTNPVDDTDAIIANTTAAVKRDADAEHAACAIVSIAGYNSDNTWAIANVDMVSACSNPTERGQYLWHKVDGKWVETDSGTNSMLMCGTESSAPAETLAALKEICAQPDAQVYTGG